MRNLRMLYLSTTQTLTHLDVADPLHGCGLAPLSLLANNETALLRADDLIRLAHEKLHTFPYRDVPVCWRRLYVEGSIWKALRVIGRVIEGQNGNLGSGQADGMFANGVDGEGTKGENENWQTEVVRVLDMALILAGGARREEVIEMLLEAVAETVKATGDGKKLELNGARDKREREHGLVGGWDDDEGHGVNIASDDEGSHKPRKKRRLKNGHGRFEQQGDWSKPKETIPPLADDTRASPTLTFPIERAKNIDMAAFEMRIQALRTPLIITDALNHWPALSDPTRQWKNPEYLLRKTIGGRRLVPVEVGRSYTDEGWGQKIITFREFMDRYLLRRQGRQAQHLLKTGPTQKRQDDNDDPDEEDTDLQTGYLAQHDLFAQIPSLRADICIPDYCYTSPPPASRADPAPAQLPLDSPLLNAWFGPAGTISPLHTDPYHNILCQVVGRKYVRLYPPEEGGRLYPRGIEGQGVSMENTSSVDMSSFLEFGEGGDDAGKDGESRDKVEERRKRRRVEIEEEFPLFKGARYLEGVLAEGECLYIPVGWWHYVQGLSTSFSVSFWWN